MRKIRMKKVFTELIYSTSILTLLYYLFAYLYLFLFFRNLFSYFMELVG
jgi:hypothetical protein